MWSYEKKLQYPVHIKNPDPAAAKIIITQLGGLNCKNRYTSLKSRTQLRPTLLLLYSMHFIQLLKNFLQFL